jgi:solute:Na+ symporter, SSS family
VEFGALNWSIVIAYLLVNMLIGFLVSRRVQTAGDYNLGDRSAPWWALGMSVLATYVSALSFLGGPAWAYGDGMAALAIHLNYPLVIFAVVVVFLPFFFNSGVVSIYEYLERRFGRTSRSAMSLLFIVTQTIATASIMTATAVVITFITGLDVRTSIVVMTVVVLIYTLIGGMNAVIWTDVFQGIVLIVGAGIVLWYALAAVSPITDAIDSLAAAGKLNPFNTDLDFSVAPTVWAGLGAMTLFHITVYGANQMMVQRALAAKSLADAKKSYLMMGFAAFFIYFVFFFIGALLFVYFEGKPFAQPNEIILVFANGLGIPGLMGILAAAILAASMSSVSSALNSLATICVADFYRPMISNNKPDAHYLMVSRLCVLFWSVAIIPMAFAFINSGGSILEQLSAVSSYFVGAKLAYFALGFLSKHATERGLLVGTVAGFGALVLVVFGIPFAGVMPLDIAWPWFVVIGGGVNIVVGWTASVVLDGFKKDWSEYTVAGQMQKFRLSGAPQKQDGWYVVPGRVDVACWVLLGFFVLTLVLMAWFAQLGHGAG